LRAGGVVEGGRVQRTDRYRTEYGHLCNEHCNGQTTEVAMDSKQKLKWTANRSCNGQQTEVAMDSKQKLKWTANRS